MRTRRIAFSQVVLAAIYAVALSTGMARASAWTADGVPAAPADSIQDAPVMTGDGAGGLYLAWHDLRSGGSIYAQHLTADGLPGPSWPVSGLLIAAGYADPVIVSDGRGGAFVAAYSLSTGPGYQHLTASGVDPAPSGAAGMHALPARIAKSVPGGLPYLMADGQGGAFLAWTQGGRLDPGVVVGHIQSNGLSILGGGTSAYGLAPTLCGDAAGGVIMCWETTGIGLRRFPADTSVAGWNAWIYYPMGTLDGPAIVSDAAGGSLVFWFDSRSGVPQVYAQHITAAGIQDPSWPSTGLMVSQHASQPGLVRSVAATSLPYNLLASDGAGGAFVAWTDLGSDSGDVFVQHVTSGGTIPPGWPDGGLAVGAGPGIQKVSALTSDGAGGVFLSWQDQRTGNWDVYAQHLNADGTTASGWPTAGIRACSALDDQLQPQICSDGAGGALVAWQDLRCSPPQVFASHIAADGSVPTAGASVVAVDVVSARADSGITRIAWRVSQGELGGTLPRVYCRQVDGPWTAVGTAWPDAGGELVYSDLGALEGCRYGYALGIQSCGRERKMGEVWIDTPLAHGFAMLAVSDFAAIADSGRVRLHWRLEGGESLQASVWRRDSCSNESAVGSGVLDDNSDFDLMDPGTQFEGHVTAYRLLVHACGADHDLGEFPVSIPARAGFVPTTTSLIFERVDTTSAALTWAETSGPASQGTVYRRDSVEAWGVRAHLSPDAGGRFHFHESGLLPLHAYEYRIGLASCGVEVLSLPVSIRTEPNPDYGLWLRAVVPNPASHALEVDLSLSGADRAMLELLDSAGRRLLERRVDGLGPGLHAYTIQDLSRVPSGSYWLRLTQSGRSQTRRVAVIH